MAPFRYPGAKVYVTPKQKSVPVDLPLPLLGIPVDGVLAERDRLEGAGRPQGAYPHTLKRAYFDVLVP